MRAGNTVPAAGDIAVRAAVEDECEHAVETQSAPSNSDDAVHRCVASGRRAENEEDIRQTRRQKVERTQNEKRKLALVVWTRHVRPTPLGKSDLV